MRGYENGAPAVLAFRRRPDKAAGGMWEFPGGKVEKNETPEAALVREVREELGVGVTVGGLVTRSSTVVGDRLIDLACYWVTVSEFPAESTDHDAIRWVTAADLRSMEWAEPDIPALDTIEEALCSPGEARDGEQ